MSAWLLAPHRTAPIRLQPRTYLYVYVILGTYIHVLDLLGTYLQYSCRCYYTAVHVSVLWYVQ